MKEGSSMHTRIAAMGIGCLAAVLVVELALRILGVSFPSFYTTDPCCGLALRSGARGFWHGEGGAFVEINSDGLRDIEHNIEKSPETFRVAVMGDSYTLARQVALESTYWWITERLLEEACPFVPDGGVEMINFGMAGWGTAQELRLYETRARQYDPDLVLLAFLTGNDLTDNYAPLNSNPMRPYYVLNDESEASSGRSQLVLDESFVDTPRYRKRQTLQWKLFVELSEWSRSIQLVNELLNRRKAAQRAQRTSANGQSPTSEPGLSSSIYVEPTTPEWRDAWRTTEALLTRFRNTVRGDGREIFVVTLSNGIQVDPDPEVRARYAGALGVEDLFGPDRRLAAHLSRIGVAHTTLAPRLAAIAEQTGRCLHGFENADPCRGHWNEDGHREAATLLAAAVCATLAEIGTEPGRAE